MELFDFKSLTEYEKSMLGFYRNDRHFINNKSGILKIVCGRGGAFYGNTVQRMIGVKENGVTLCQCVLIKHRAYDALTVSFFEAAEGAFEAVGVMMDYAEGLGKEFGCKRIEVSLDGHCNYSVGFLSAEAKGFPVFGESYSPDYYNGFFVQGYQRVSFSSFCGSLAEVEDGVKSLLPRVRSLEPDIRLECADFRHFRQAMKRYTDLCNVVFSDHRYCFTRDYEEDMELFAPMKPLLSPCNLIFAVKGGRDIGFIFLYPDFNELIPAGGQAGVRTLVKHKLLGRRISAMKIAEIAVLPELRSKGVVLLLFAEAIKQTKRHYKGVEKVVSSWILDENLPSQNVTRRFAKEPHKRFAAYEKEI